MLAQFSEIANETSLSVHSSFNVFVLNDTTFSF
jgi:hypothetical protein